MFKIFLVFLIPFFFIFVQAENIGSNTGYKIPRFVSLKSNEVNLRIGSSTNYPVILQYNMMNLPVEIIEEYGVWRKINDFEGNEGWIKKTLLKGDRFAIINHPNKSSIQIFSKPQENIIGEIGEFNIVKIDTCLIKWCKIKHQHIKGWVNKENLWGVYTNEKINVPFYQNIINIFWKVNF